ncbi:hypothetical protein CIT292_09667 [Citrobacter youngae ATCC 29220]|uniref:Uncharacterized protein n=1 Tax=Citrobacter youngae ATCC 29220 TaxID=500640 RepID=D4BGL8_9ENTR|nr:hypothetical protein CIT292_09667 [Citrobacter youngae ATCC 29220]
MGKWPNTGPDNRVAGWRRVRLIRPAWRIKPKDLKLHAFSHLSALSLLQH